jgi:hypothetical protein
MDHIWTPERSNQDPGEHPVVAVIAIVAMVVAVLLIAWARVEVHGTADLEALAVAEVPPAVPQTQEERQVDEAVTAARFATGLSP